MIGKCCELVKLKAYVINRTGPAFLRHTIEAYNQRGRCCPWKGGGVVHTAPRIVNMRLGDAHIITIIIIITMYKVAKSKVTFWLLISLKRQTNKYDFC